MPWLAELAWVASLPELGFAINFELWCNLSDYTIPHRASLNHLLAQRIVLHSTRIPQNWLSRTDDVLVKLQYNLFGFPAKVETTYS